jgi:thioredoxin reductase
MTPFLAYPFIERLARKGITIYTGVKGEEFRDSSLVITTREGEEKVIEVNTIVLATGSRPNAVLFQELEGLIPEMYCVGDCVEPRNIMEATTEGFSIGRTI